MLDLLPIPCAILAGGQSRRMGTDKALLDLLGQPLLVRAALLAQQVSPHTLVVGRNQPPNWPPTLPVQFLPDPTPAFSGPIAGIRAALLALNAPLLVLPCDMPLLTPTTLHRLFSAHQAAGPHATLAATPDPTGNLSAEPLLAIYTPHILPTLDAFIHAGRRSLQQLLHLPSVHLWHVPNDTTPQLLNVNDAATLARARDHLSATPGDPS